MGNAELKIVVELQMMWHYIRKDFTLQWNKQHRLRSSSENTLPMTVTVGSTNDIVKQQKGLCTVRKHPVVGLHIQQQLKKLSVFALNWPRKIRSRFREREGSFLYCQRNICADTMYACV